MLHYLFVYCILIAYINLQKAPSTMTPISVMAYNVVGALISFLPLVLFRFPLSIVITYYNFLSISNVTLLFTLTHNLFPMIYSNIK